MNDSVKKATDEQLQQELKRRQQDREREKQREIEELEDRIACLKNPNRHSRKCTCFVCGGDF